MPGRRPPKRRDLHWAAYLWPGLPHLWLRGSWAGLALALGFTVLANVTAVTVCVYPELLAPRLKLACGGVTIAIWLAALVETRSELRRIAARRQAELAGIESEEDLADKQSAETADRKFIECQTAYLRGDWITTERGLLDLLTGSPGDIQARLLLATLWRRQGRNPEAAAQLRRLERLEAARPWGQEIESERKRLEPTPTASPSDPPHQDCPPKNAAA